MPAVSVLWTRAATRRTARRRLLLAATCAAAVSGCTGVVEPSAGDEAEVGSPGAGPGRTGTGGPGGTGTTAGSGGTVPPAGAAPAAFACAGRSEAVDTGLRRLTDRQYRNTLGDLIAWALGSQEAAARGLGALATALSEIPTDTPKALPQDLHGSFRRLDQDVEQAHVEGWYQAAGEVGRYLTAPERLRQVTGGCSDAFTADCLDRFIRTFGGRALRRPLDDAEVAYYRGFYGGTGRADPAGFADVIAGLLASAPFLYHVEHGRGDGAVVELGPFELAARLSYHFWDSMPDEALWKAAESGAILRDDEYRRQVDRLHASPRARATVREFYRDWLELERLEPLDAENRMPLFRAFAGTNLPSSMLRRNMIEEVLDLVDHFTYRQPSGFAPLLQTDLSFARTRDLAELYGLPAWDGQGAPPAFRSGERPGLLTRAAFLATGTANTRPVMKGVFIRESILCDEIPPAPDNAAANPPELSPTASTRQVVEALTEQPGSACAGCHRTLINPLGYATENFDALGRPRTAQRLFSPDGKPLGEVPVDTRAVPQVVPGDQRVAAGAGDLMRFILESGKAHACFVRHYFRFSFGRWEDLARDGCTLEALRKALVDGGGSIGGMLKQVALTPTFKQRAFAR